MEKKRTYLLNNIFFPIILTVLMLLVVIRQVDVKIQIRVSIDNCLKVIIPSLYGVMFLSEIIVRSGIYRLISKPFGFLGKIFNIPADYVSIFLISHIGGYPVGAKLVNTLQQKSDRLTHFCFAAGPAFIGGVVSSELYNNSRIGLLLLISITLANIIYAILTGLFSEKAVPQREKSEIKLDIQILIDSAVSVGTALLKICAMILVCSIIIGLIRNINSPLIFSFIDVTNIIFWEKNNIENLPLMAAILSFGGLCVTAQVISIIKINAFKFIRARIICSSISYFICKILTPLFIQMPPSAKPVFFNNLIPLFSCLIILITVSLIKNYKKEKN